MSAANRVLKNTGFLYLKMGITMFISLYTTRLILNSLGASDFGIFNIVGGAIAMLGFINGSMAAATQRYMSYAEGEGNERKKILIFNNSVLLHVAISIFVVILLEIAGLFFFNGILSIPHDRIVSAKIIYHCAVIATMFTIQAVPYDAVINAHENMLYYAVIGIFESLLKLAAAIIVVYTMSDKLIVYGVLMALISFLMRIIMMVYCRSKYKECRISFRCNYNCSLVMEMGRFAGWNALSSVTSVATQYGQGILLNHFFGTIVNAAQGITNQISGQFGALSTNAMKALNPVIVKSAGAHDYEKMYKGSRLGSKILFFITSVCFLPILTNLKSVLCFWLVEIPDYTYIFVSLYLIVNIIDTVSISLPTAINGVGKIKGYQLSITLCNGLPLTVCLFLFYFGYPPFTIYILMLFASMCKLASRIYFANRVCGFSLYDMLCDDVVRTFFPFIVGIGMAFVFNEYIMPGNGVITTIIQIIENVFVYSILFCILGFKYEDRRYFIDVITGIVRLKKH